MAAIAILPLVAGAAAAGHVAAFVAIRAQCACSAVLNSRLWKAAERGDAPAVAKLLKTRVWVDRKTTKRRYTALHFAAANGHAAVVRLLLERADALCRDALGNTPIHLAVLGRQRYSGAFATRDGHLECLEELLLAWHLPLGGVNAANAAGDTALHLAAQAGDEAVVRMLYEYSQCMPEIKNKEGFTALHLAALGNHLAVLRFLLARGADIHVVSRDGRGPLECCSGATLVTLEATVLRGRANHVPLSRHAGSASQQFVWSPSPCAALLLALVALSAAATTAAVSPGDNTSPLALGADISAAPADRCAGALLHFWPLDSKSGAADVAGGVHGVLHGDAASYEYGAPSSPDALSFDGKSTFVDIPGLALSGPVSISLWARFNSPGLSRQYSYLFWFANELKQYGAPGLNPVTDAAGFVALSPHFETGWAALNWRLDDRPAQATLTGDAPASLARGWHHWMLVLDAFNGTSSSTARLYIDGALAGSSDAFGPLTSSARAHLFLGRSGNVSPDAGAYGDPLFAGAMSHVRVLRGAMGAEQAAEMYRRPRDGGCEPPPPGMPPAGWAYAGCFVAPADDAASFPQLLGEGVSYDECFARAAKYDFTLAALQGVTAHGTPSSEWTAARCWGGMSGETPYDALGAAQCAPLAAALPGLWQQIVYRRVAPPTPAPGQPAPHGGPVIINVVVIAIKCSFTLCSVGSIVFAFGAAAREHIANRRNDASRAALAPALADDAAAAAAETGSSGAVAKPHQSIASGHYPPPPTAAPPSAPPMRPLPAQRGECAICLENPPDSVLTPCGHAYCSECCTALAEVPHAKCALCRSRIDSVQRIYL